MIYFFISVNLLAIAGDINITWTSPVYPKLYSNDRSKNPLGRPITQDEDSWMGSLMNIGAMLGTFPFGFLAQKLGRKVALLSVAPAHFIAYLSMAFAKHVYIYYFGRFLSGLAVGGGYTLLPMYIAEIAEDSTRGIYGVTLGVFWSFGNFLPYAIGPFLSIKTSNLIFAAIPVLFFVTFAISGTESPYFLLAGNKVTQAENVLMKLRSAEKDAVQFELVRIQMLLREETHGTWMDIFSQKDLRKFLAVSLCLISFQQLVGSNVISFYMQSIIDSAGTNLSSAFSSVGMGICFLISSMIVPFIIERFGKKSITIFSSIGNSISLSSLSVYFYIKEHTDWDISSLFWLPALSLVSSIFTFQIGLGITPWTISSELFPNKVRASAATAVSATCWVMSFLVTKYFDDMVDLLSNAGVFLFFSGMAIACAVFTYVFVPEEKGKMLGQVKDMLSRKGSYFMNSFEDIGNKISVSEKNSAWNYLH